MITTFNLIFSSSYSQTPNISRTLVVNKIADHSDVVETSHVDAAPITSSFSTPGFNGLWRDKSMTRQEISYSWCLVRLMQEVWRYIYILYLYLIRLSWWGLNKPILIPRKADCSNMLACTGSVLASWEITSGRIDFTTAFISSDRLCIINCSCDDHKAKPRCTIYTNLER